MAKSPSRVCWDACAWIALIQSESIVEGGIARSTRCRSVIEQAKRGKIEIVSSALCLAEVCKNKDLADADPGKIAAFFESDYLLLVSLDRRIGERARELMMQLRAAGTTNIKPQDACHLATALLVPDVVELHTFDKRLRDLGGNIMKADGTPLKICWPDVSDPPPPLLSGRHER